jgi:uncharacterized membrane protein (UPF0127 family)
MSRTHFLQPLLRPDAPPYVLRNERTGIIAARTLEIAADSESRRRGLLGRTSLAGDAVMIIAPCNAVHMFFMKFSIDVVFTDRAGRVVKICAGLRPWRIAVAPRAFCALEFAAGAVTKADTCVGDRLEIVEENSAAR